MISFHGSGKIQSRLAGTAVGRACPRYGGAEARSTRAQAFLSFQRKGATLRIHLWVAFLLLEVRVQLCYRGCAPVEHTQTFGVLDQLLDILLERR